MLIAVKDRPIQGQSGCAFIDGLDEGPVCIFGSPEGEYLLPFRPGDHNRVDFARPDRRNEIVRLCESLFGFDEPGPEGFELLGDPSDLYAIGKHWIYFPNFRPMTIFSSSDMSPMNLFVGRGSSLIRVGKAMMSEFLVAPGD
jgi:hypothetical protein